ncbi:OTU-like cysteine protease [Novymonas esmeraldas]|uniref:OTU-like cysteine protease n=1 Tax=Novymonas esmeraldas TaxID=1808958 RepID=A0AAW0EVP0_9TRYP
MEYLDDLLNKKVDRERLSAAADGVPFTPTVTAAAGARHVDGHGTAGSRPLASAGPRLCWLCNRTSPLRFRLQGTIHLCFTCFRASYLTLLLPLINTPARRESDAGFLRLIYNIEDDRAASVSSTGDESLASTYGEIIEPQRASFVMNSSMMRQRREEEQQQRRLSATRHAGGSGAVAAGGLTTSAKTFWNCPRCTFLNAALARECEACGFINPGTVACPVCKAHCAIGLVGSPLAKSNVMNKCVGGEPHCIWNCRECSGLNTLDGDRCSLCHQPRYWACSQCTALHHMARGEDGLRYCPTCGAYNTPDDVMVGQAKIDKEAKYAEMVTAQRDAERRRGDQDQRQHPHDGPHAVAGTTGMHADGGDEVVFGVNDADTLEERARQKQIESNERRLLSRLNRLHISRNVHKTDGNCLFSALANQLFGQPRLHYLVRSLATAYMSEHSADYSILFDGAAEWRAYLAAMKEQGTWGDELCLNAAARCFRVNIHVITSDRERWHIVFQYDQLGNSRSQRGGGGGGAGSSGGETATTAGQKAGAVANSEEPLSSSPRMKSIAAAGPPKYDGVSLFLAYLAPVHYDDITPSPVAHLQLGELLSVELNKRMRRKHSSRSAGASSNPAPPLPLASGISTAEASVITRLSGRSPAAEPVAGATRLRTDHSDSLVRSVLESSTGSNATAPLVPRSRPPSGKQDAHKGPEPPSRPPPNGLRGLPSDYSY